MPNITNELRPCSPCYPTRAVAEPIVSHIRNPYLTFPGRVHHFHRRLDPGLGRPHGGFSDCGCMDPFRTRAPHQCTEAQGGNIGPQSLGYSITDRIDIPYYLKFTTAFHRTNCYCHSTDLSVTYS